MELIDNTEKKRYSLGGGTDVRWFDLPRTPLGALFDNAFGMLRSVVQRAALQPDYRMRPLDAILTRREREAEAQRRDDERVSIIVAQGVGALAETLAVFWAYVADDLAWVRERIASREPLDADVEAKLVALDRRISELERGRHAGLEP